MPKFTQFQAIGVRANDSTSGKQYDELELFALGDDGKVYRFMWTASTWKEMGT